jgi:glycosyltransferase involved in cell wall biosynthesis
LKVVHVIDALGLGGGAEHSLVGLLPLLADRGIDSQVVCLYGRDGGLQAQVAQAGFPIAVLGERGAAARTRALRRALTRPGPDLVHSTLAKASTLTAVARLGTGIPQIQSLVSTSFDPVRLSAMGAVRWRTTARRVIRGFELRHLISHVHALSGAVRDEAVHVLGVTPAKVTIIPRGRSSEALGRATPERRQAVRAALGVADAAPLILTVGRQDPEKAQDLLVRAFAMVRDAMPDAVLAIAGREGGASRELRRAIDESEAGEAVLLLGHRTDVGDLCAAADVFAFPSLYEGFGGVLVEALALELPIVASDVPAMIEALDQGRTGVVVPRGDPEALGQALIGLIDDTDRRAALAAAGRALFEARYELGRIADATVEMYRTVARR